MEQMENDKNYAAKINKEIADLKRQRRIREKGNITTDFVGENVDMTGIDQLGQTFTDRQQKKQET